MLHQNEPEDTINQQPADTCSDKEISHIFHSGYSYISDTLTDTISFQMHMDRYLSHSDDDDSDLYGYYGIDVSTWQENIKWHKVKCDTVPHPLKFYIIKATQGSDIVDSHFFQNWDSCCSDKTIRGAYHFYTYLDDPKEQALNYINTVSLTKGDFRPIIDIELDCPKCTKPEVPKDRMVKDLKIFLNEIQKHYKTEPILYTYSSFFQEYLKEDFSDYTFWMAQYSSHPPLGFPRHKKDENMTRPPIVLMWQFTGNEQIEGIDSTVDMSFLPIHELEQLLLP